MSTARATADPGPAATTVREPLRPLRDALLADAERAAAERVRAAQQDAEAIEAEARQAQSRTIARARAAGESDVAAELARRRLEARRDARLVVATAQQRAYDELRHAACAAVRDLVAEPGQREALVAAACARLAVERASVTVREHPAGGVVVVTAADGRRVDGSVPALVEEVLSGLDLSDLWAPA